MKNKLLLKALLSYAFVVLFVTTLSHGAEDTYACAPEVQDNGMVVDVNGKIDYTASGGMKELWKCPVLPNLAGDDYPLYHKLSNIDYQNGYYTCDYGDSGRIRQTCKYKSRFYSRMKQEINDNLFSHPIADGSGTVTGVLDKTDNIDFNTIFNKVGAPSQEVITLLNNKFNPSHRKIIEIQEGLLNDKFKNVSDTNQYLKDIEHLSYAHLVEPYLVSNSATDVRKGNTFSNFLSGLITLDGDIVAGYNEGSGKLIIDNQWKLDSTSFGVVDETDFATQIGDFFSPLLSMFSSDPEPTEAEKKAQKDNFVDAMGGSDMQLKIYSYTEIFELKLWGYYYNLQRRLDLGYDFIAHKLLWIMALWFVLVGGTKTGIGYLLNGERKHEATEGDWLKGITMLLGVSAFMFSLSSPISSIGANGGDVQGQAEMQNEMRKNKTIIKYVIRESAQMGADIATMISDLGLDAFLSFAVKKQQVYSFEQIKNEYDKGISQLYMFYPAMDTMLQCRDYYKTTDADFYKVKSPTQLMVNPEWKNGTWANDKNVDEISYEVCKNAYKIYAVAPYDVSLSIAEADKQTEHVDEVMAQAMYQFSLNSIAIQEKLGWVSSFSVPLTYFVMKEGDMFLAPSVNYDDVERVAKGTIGSLTEGGEVLKDSSFWANTADSAVELGAEGLSNISNLLLYNILPAFSPMQQAVQQHFGRIYGDMLEIETNNKSAGKQILLSRLKKLTKRGKRLLGKTAGVRGKIMMKLSEYTPAITSSFTWRTLIFFSSFIIALYAWKLAFTVVFIASISLMFLLKIMFYFKDLLVHFVSSLFVFVWAFTQKGGEGEKKMTNFVRDTLVLVMLQPSLIVLSGFVFIFLYELMYVLYSFVLTAIMESEKATISLMTVANNSMSLFDSMGSYMNIMSIQSMGELLVDVFAFFIAIVTILKFPEYVLRKLGLADQDTIYMSQINQETAQKSDRLTNPMGG